MRFVGRVAVSRPLTPSTHAIEVEKPPEFRFLPTQFTWLQLKTPEGPDARPMSLATSPTRPRLEYAVRVSDSAWKRAFAALQPGDPVWVAGPIGDFVLNERRPAILVAGGIGITPLKGMAEYAADNGLSLPIRPIYSSRAQTEIVYEQELAALEKRNPHFQIFHTLTREPEGSPWRGRKGRITIDLLKEAADGLTRPVYYVTGTPDMVDATLDQLAQMKLTADDVEVEEFRGY